MSITNTLKSLSVVAVAAVAFATVPMPQGTPFVEAAFAQDARDLQDTSEEFNTKFNELLKEGNVTAA